MAFPVVQVVTGTQFATNTTSHDVNMPATVASGDLLLTFVCSSRSTGERPNSFLTSLADDLQRFSWAQLVLRGRDLNNKERVH